MSAFGEWLLCCVVFAIWLTGMCAINAKPPVEPVKIAELRGTI